jgi:hypothetical protein
VENKMTKKELVEMLSNQEVEIIGIKQRLMDMQEKCFTKGELTDEKTYDLIQKKMEFYNGQQALIGDQVKMFKINRTRYYDTVNSKDLERIRNKFKTAQ